MPFKEEAKQACKELDKEIVLSAAHLPEVHYCGAVEMSGRLRLINFSLRSALKDLLELIDCSEVSNNGDMVQHEYDSVYDEITSRANHVLKTTLEYSK